LDQGGVVAVTQRGVGERRANHGESGVTGAHGVVALGSEVFEEGIDEHGVATTPSTGQRHHERVLMTARVR
jgi:hypothetical protein